MKKYLKIFLILFSCLFTSCTANNKTTIIDNVTVDTTTNNVETYKMMIYEYVYSNLPSSSNSCLIYDVEILGYSGKYVYCKYTVIFGRAVNAIYTKADAPQTLYIRILIKEE